MGSFGIGASVRRKEDLRFLTGKGRYTDDINRPGQLQACLLRSPHAHAEIAGIDTAKAMAAPGVAAIFKAPATGAVFALEVPYQDDFARKMLLPALVSSATGYLVFRDDILAASIARQTRTGRGVSLTDVRSASVCRPSRNRPDRREFPVEI